MGMYTKLQSHQQQSQQKDQRRALYLLMERNCSISSTYTARMSCNAMPRMEQCEAHLHRSLCMVNNRASKSIIQCSSFSSKIKALGISSKALTCRSLELPHTATASSRTGGCPGTGNLQFSSTEQNSTRAASEPSIHTQPLPNDEIEKCEHSSGTEPVIRS